MNQKHVFLAALVVAALSVPVWAANAANAGGENNPGGTPPACHAPQDPATILQHVNDQIQHVQQLLAQPNLPAAVNTAAQQLVTDLNTFKTDLSQAEATGAGANGAPPDQATKAKLKADHETVKADHEALQSALQAAGMKSGPGGQGGAGGPGGQGGPPHNISQEIQDVSNKIQRVQQHLTQPNLPAAVSAAAQKLLNDLNTLKTDLIQAQTAMGVNNNTPPDPTTKAKLQADHEAVKADHEALQAAMQASGGKGGPGGPGGQKGGGGGQNGPQGPPPGNN